MNIALITGSAGLVGSESAAFFSQQGFKVIGIDNDMRRYFFGEEASTQWNSQRLQKEIKDYTHYAVDIRDEKTLGAIFSEYSYDIKVVIHTAAQPSHDWAAKEPFTDFSINANGTLNLLEMTRRHASEAVFIFTSTNKVYGDLPNDLPLIEQESRYDLSKDHPFFEGINESMSIDQSKHSLFGASKVAADILVQEYGRYFGMKTVCFRGGCLTGPRHSAAMLHGFLSYLMKCAISGQPYHILGFKGKQVRDNIHSFDLVNAFYHFFLNPRPAQVYNIGGGRENSCSIREAIELCEKLIGRKMKLHVHPENRSGDQIWYISNLTKFKTHYPSWKQQYSLRQTLEEMYQSQLRRWV